MAIYHAYKITTASRSIYGGGCTDPATMLLKLAEDLRTADQEKGCRRIVIGQVEGESKADALKAVRHDNWLKEGFADCQGAPLNG